MLAQHFCQECHWKEKVGPRQSSHRWFTCSCKFPKVRPRQLLQVFKGAYGGARGQLAGLVTMTELRCARAVFTKHDTPGNLQ